MNTRRIAPYLLAAPALLFGALWLHAGPLNPPVGPVTGSYKTLSEVEPRIAINPANTPGDATSLYKITQPGSYYLTGNIAGVVGKHGIAITASGVTVDLMGFDAVGVSGSIDGVSATVSSLANITVRNGSIRGWGGRGVNFLPANNSPTVIDVRASSNATAGISIGQGGTVTGCVAYLNGGTGISIGYGSTITACSAYRNTASGIASSPGCTISGCTAGENSGTGIGPGSGCTVTGCTAYNNATGIWADTACTISNCTAHLNNIDGIRVGGYCLVLSNTCNLNGNSGDGAGIHATSSDNRIEGNVCTFADRGIDVDVLGNIIIRNTCSGNTTNWDIVANNICGPILDRTAPASAAILGNSAPSSLGSTDPNANFTY